MTTPGLDQRSPERRARDERPLDPRVKLAERSRVIIVASEET